MSESHHEPQGLYTPQLESDACGIGLIAQLHKQYSHQLVSDALTMLENMEHRGACGCDPESGDGAGIMIHVPHALFVSEDLPFNLPEPGSYGVGCFFFPKGKDYDSLFQIITEAATDLGLDTLGTRQVPVDSTILGAASSSTEPDIYHIFFQPKEPLAQLELDRVLLILRKHVTHKAVRIYPQYADDFYATSLSCRTMVYKGQLTSMQVRQYYLDLQNEHLNSAVALVHSRFSTNTIPRWKLAQPFRMIAHNGEINTIEGNKNWWRAREKGISTDYFTPAELKKVFPLFNPTNSDSSIFDNVLEFIVHNGRPLPHAMMMMIPEAWQNADHMLEYKRAFYEYHEGLMEPWDGPASMCFTDGSLVGGTLDRNGLRPSRYCLTNDHRLILASETGVLPVDPSIITYKGRLEPGKILVADLDEKRVIGDEELKAVLCNRLPYKEWVNEAKLDIADIDMPEESLDKSPVPLVKRQTAQGYTLEDEDLIIKGMIANTKEPVGSMGADIPLAVLSRYTQHISSYFRQQFAQVTNPPIDSLRESEYMTLKTVLGGSSNILNLKENTVRFIRLESPVLSERDFLKLRHIDDQGFKSAVIHCVFDKNYGEGDLQRKIQELCEIAEQYVNAGINLLILKNSGVNENKVPVPSLLTTGAVHHYLVEKGLRQRASLIIDGGDIIETHHVATLLGFGADAIFPGLIYDVIRSLHKREKLGELSSAMTGINTYLKAVNKGLLKIMSKLGVSTVQSYRGAQTFEALGISREVVDICFKGTISRIGGMTFDMLAKEALIKHSVAFEDNFQDELIDLGIYQWKRRGEYHLFNPTTIHLLQNSTRKNNYQIYKKYAHAINEQAERACTLRSLLQFRKGESIPIEEVEPVEQILQRFATGAMSFGSISHEAHTTLARAMNRIGGKSNSGEGGEDETRFKKREDGDWERSAIKQVASGRFGVTINYLTNAIELQIKMAQGAKPGEGGQLPGHKVDGWIARVRNSTPGVGLISPPPHHDIYSIEDLAQLIFDLKNANRQARISVKLVSKAGVGIIASGVAKGKADHILIAGHDGGTGASPLSSIRYAGLPWELGLAETHQTLLQNQIRNRVVLQADGQIRTGRDMAIATLLGAEEWGVATAALVVEGCILMRKCHLNTCPVGIATQNPELRKKYDGRVDDVVNFFYFLANDLREIMAELGFRTIQEMVGRSDLLHIREDLSHWKLQSVDLSPILYRDPAAETEIGYNNVAQDHEIDHVLDRQLIEYADLALEDKITISSAFDVKSTDRAVGTMLSNEIAKKYGSGGLDDDSINFRFRGSAGQSFGAFGAKGLTFTLEGDANDYFGKGLSGAKLIISPDRNSTFNPQDNIIIGNVALYGATSGQVYIKGMAGERFCVRNSGAKAVVEGVGAHGCEYMTGGQVVILGKIGRNFGAGMSGGIAYIYDPEHNQEQYLNMGMILVEALSQNDEKTLRQAIRDHFKYTGSLKALQILQSWEGSKKQFLKIMPIEYKRVLAEMAQKETLTTA
ncbi:MAG: glutamate synthase large subunit [Bacteroidota bacterium]